MSFRLQASSTADFVSFTQATAQLTKSIFRNPVNPIFFLNSSLSSTNWKANFVTLLPAQAWPCATLPAQAWPCATLRKSAPHGRRRPGCGDLDLVFPGSCFARLPILLMKRSHLASACEIKPRCAASVIAWNKFVWRAEHIKAP